jgi:transglutaminase superfamily protein
VGSSSSRQSDWRAFLALSGPERRLFLSAFLVLPIITGVLKLTGYQRLQRFIDRRAKTPTESLDSWPAASTTDRMVKVAAARSPVPSACLSQSLTLLFLLRRQGIEGELCIGVRKGIGELDAHAWVEHRGRPLNDSDDVRHRYTTIHPAAPTA